MQKYCWGSYQNSTFLFSYKCCQIQTLSIEVNWEDLFFSLLSKRTNEKQATLWSHGNIALFVFIFPSEMNVYAAKFWRGSCDSDYCVCFSRHHARGLIICSVTGVLEMLTSSALCCIKVFLFELDCFYLWCKDKSTFLHSFLSALLQISCYIYF